MANWLCHSENYGTLTSHFDNYNDGQDTNPALPVQIANLFLIRFFGTNFRE